MTRLPAAQAAPGPPRPRARRRRLVLTAAAVALLAAAGISFGVYQVVQPPSPVTTYAVAFDGHDPVAVVSAGGAVRLEQLPSGKLTATLATLQKTSGPLSVAFSSDGAMVAAEYHGGRATVYDTRTGRRVAAFPDPPAGTSALAISHDHATLAVSAADGRTYLWNIATGRQAATLTGPAGTQSVAGAAFGPGDKTLAVALSDAGTAVWDLATRKLTATFPDGDGELAVSPDGSDVAVASASGTDPVILWRVATRQEAGSFAAGPVRALAFSPDGSQLAAGGPGGVAVRDLASRQQVAELTGTQANPLAEVTSLAYSPDGKTIAAGDVRGDVVLLAVR